MVQLNQSPPLYFRYTYIISWGSVLSQQQQQMQHSNDAMTAISTVLLETLSSPPVTIMVQENRNEHVVTEETLRYHVMETVPYPFSHTVLKQAARKSLQYVSLQHRPPQSIGQQGNNYISAITGFSQMDLNLLVAQQLTNNSFEGSVPTAKEEKDLVIFIIKLSPNPGLVAKSL